MVLERALAWAQGKKDDDPEFFRRLARQQAPRYFWVGCSDSRVSATQVLDRNLGEVFVHRNVANIADCHDPNFAASLQYAVEVLKVEHIFVVGHYGCGGIDTAMHPLADDAIGTWLAPVRALFCEACEVTATPDADRLCEYNVIAQVEALARCQVVNDAWRRRQCLTIHGWVYVIEEGVLRPVCDAVSAPR